MLNGISVVYCTVLMCVIVLCMSIVYVGVHVGVVDSLIVIMS